jgi:low temperature requirement protein LtrA
MSVRKAALPGDVPVTRLELFFDLVFVYLVTQLTDLVVESHGATGYLHAAAVLFVTWWMYDGYAFLSNNVPPTTTSTRLPMLLAMTCFLVMAIAVPDVFGDSAWQFAIAFLLVTSIHFVSFTRSSLGGSAAAIRGIAPTNFGTALLIVAAAIVGEEWGWVCWALAVAVLSLSVVRNVARGFNIRAEHFAERHALIVIIALGETIIAIGKGAEHHLDDAEILIAVIASMVLISTLWWAYFGGDEEEAAGVLDATPTEQQAYRALISYSLTHLLHVFGLVLIAAGLHEVMHDPGHHLDTRIAVTMAAGVATYLVGEAAFRGSLGLGGTVPLLGGAALALLMSPLGVHVSGLVELLALAAVCILTVLVAKPSRPADPADPSVTAADGSTAPA